MRKINYAKVFFGETRLKDIAVGATKWEVFKYKFMRATRATVMAVFTLGMLYGAFFTGRVTTLPTYVRAEVQVPVEVEIKASVMDRIKKCESGGNQFKNGQVLIHVNNDGSYDQGVFQINSVHNTEATKLGYNLAVEKDNEAYALYLYKNRGTEDWYSSKSCWSK